MKIAFTHDLRLTAGEEEAEPPSPEAARAIALALSKGDHEVAPIEVSGPASHLVARLEDFAPDLVFNLAQGHRGRSRPAFYPALFEELGYPYIGSDSSTITLTLDKWLTKMVLKAHGVDSPQGRLFTARDLPDISRIEGILGGSLGVPLPAIVKPNFEGFAKGPSDDSVARDWLALRGVVARMLEQYPRGVLVEEFIPGLDLTVPFIEGVGSREGVLQPIEFALEPPLRGKHNIQFSPLKRSECDRGQQRCPAHLPRDITARLRQVALTVVRVLGLRDVASIDFRLGKDGRLYFLKVDAQPSLESQASLMLASSREGLDYDATIAALLASAALRWKLRTGDSLKMRARQAEQLLRYGYHGARPGGSQSADSSEELTMGRAARKSRARPVRTADSAETPDTPQPAARAALRKPKASLLEPAS
jgi:D-alanine-D-alanine ligase